VFDVPELTAIAEKHGVTEAQVSLAWLLEKENVATNPKARGEHILENYRATSLSLDLSDVETIDGIDREFSIYD
jgi:2,5-diketo-D-gluconate reductase B